MKNILKNRRWLRWTVAGSFGLMLTLNVMVGLEFGTGEMLPALTLNELNSQSFAWGESASGKRGGYEPTNLSLCCPAQGWESCYNLPNCP
jgi:hypothetical protein